MDVFKTEQGSASPESPENISQYEDDVHYKVFPTGYPSSPDLWPKEINRASSDGGGEAETQTACARKRQRTGSPSLSTIQSDETEQPKVKPLQPLERSIEEKMFDIERRLRIRLVELENEVAELQWKHRCLCANLETTVSAEMLKLQRNMLRVCTHVGVPREEDLELDALLDLDRDSDSVTHTSDQ
ncbi:hypothetical protein OH76DRAFT_1487927 [Lentinus brumalis]|uniref:Uncharacterized protein n=1 Tax=Lentinus brumalis TaxID=2498619 RepID=A0A371CST3_9APHY|nr:hypothetical protein OH76DRAFT_1487927 [Polyporus brumalis]